jgi:hypothetical protein
MNTYSKSEHPLYGIAILLSLSFAILYTQSPLYTSDQNTYFLHGLANGGLGFLSQDWMAKTIDPYPAFSFLVSLTYSYFPQFLFYIYYFVILSFYLYSIIGVASKTWGIDRSYREYLSYFVFIAVIHSFAFGYLSSRLMGIDLRKMFCDGLAGQYILGRVFQPSTFGVFLILSIYAFLCDRHFWALLCLSIAAIFHPTYLLSAAALTISYMIVTIVNDNMIKKSLLIGMLSLCLALPSLCYTYLAFDATPPDISNQAQTILANYRMPHHAKPTYWFNTNSLIQIFIVVIALLITKKKRIFPLLLIPFLISATLTILQVVTENKFLALLFPWRISSFLVPLSSCLIVGRAISIANQKFSLQFLKYGTAITLLLLGLVSLLLLSGVLATRYEFEKHFKRYNAPVMDHVATVSETDNVYLIPLELQDFRLHTGTPIFVDKKSHPYKDIEVIEWYNRIQIANKFYTARGESACNILQEITHRYGVTHVIVKSGIQEFYCGFLQKVFRDDNFIVYEITINEKIHLF